MQLILNRFSGLEVEERPVVQARGQVLAENVVATFNVPPLDNSAMDGYAVQTASIEGLRRTIRWR